MKVSIIIPVFNVEQYIADSLSSVVSQTMQDDVECIIVDDCGNDNSMDVVDKFVDAYRGAIKFSIIHHNHNKGLSAARNSGINVAKGEYAYFLDSDDTMTKDSREHKMSQRANQTSHEVYIWACERPSWSVKTDFRLTLAPKVNDQRWDTKRDRGQC